MGLDVLWCFQRRGSKSDIGSLFLAAVANKLGCRHDMVAAACSTEITTAGSCLRNEPAELFSRTHARVESVSMR